MTDFYSISPEQQAERLTELARRALPHWSLPEDSKVELIKHRENAVFSVTDEASRYALRVHRAGYHTDAQLLSELQWIAALDSEALRTPQILPTADGGSFARVSAPSVPEERQVDLLEWFDGEPLGSVEGGVVEDPATTFRQVGELMARLHNHSEHWQRPDGFDRHAWDEEGILGDGALWGRYWELAALTRPQVDLLHRAADGARSDLTKLGRGADRYGLIHADFLPENLLRGADGICVIDFDDGGFGWHLFDVATALFFQAGEENFDEIAGALVAGYRSQRELPDDHLELLPLFLLLRGFTYLGWAHTRSETETAKELTPMVIEGVTQLAEAYLS